jgi:hypothetical protein
MLEFVALTVRFPRGCELLSLRFVKTQRVFSKVADEHEPFKAKLMVPLSAGMLNRSDVVKVVAS